MVSDERNREAEPTPVVVVERFEDALNLSKCPTSPRKKKSPRKRFYEKMRQWDNARTSLRGCGPRQKRRLENLNFLLSLAGDADSEERDVYEPGYSAFTTLLQDPNKMEIWNDFLNHTEEEQEAYLASSEWASGEPQCTLEKDETEAAEKDERKEHPAAMDAQTSFARIDGHLKRLLRRQHTPLGVLAGLEEELIGFFTQFPNSIYVSQLASGFERMFLHALCQYMNLKAKSRSAGRQRQTHVENDKPSFVSPEVSLTQFLTPPPDSPLSLAEDSPLGLAQPPDLPLYQTPPPDQEEQPTCS